eukprot:51027-Amphidinium_carterae.1
MFHGNDDHSATCKGKDESETKRRLDFSDSEFAGEPLSEDKGLRSRRQLPKSESVQLEKAVLSL